MTQHASLKIHHPHLKTLIDMIAFRAEEGERVAYTFADEPHTFGEMWRELNRFAAWWIERGLERGDRVLLVLPNGPEFFTGFYGVQRAGGIAVPVFPGSGPGRVRDIVELSGARAVVVPSETPERLIDQLAGLIDIDQRPILRVSEVAAPFADVNFPAIDPDDVAYFQYTSGSTGLPKGVQLSHADLLINVEQLIAGMRITRDEIFVSWLPVYHDMGLVLKTLVPFYLGATLHLLPTSLKDIHEWLQAIHKHRGTFTAAPDFAYRVCLRYIKDPGHYDLSSLRVALNAAEPVRVQTVRDFERAFGLENVMVPGYGLAEATVGVSMWTPNTPIKVDERGFVSVGPVFPRIEVKILGKEDRELPAGEVGEILLKSPANTRGYFRNPEADAQLFWGDGYIRTGDLGYVDAEGDLFIVGRQKNVIIHGGRNLSPREIEEAVDAASFVRFCAAVGVDRGRAEGEQVYIFAELRDATGGEDALHDMATQIVETFYERLGLRPGRVYLLKPRSIPLTYNGKTQHVRLKQMFLDGELRAKELILYPDF